MELETAEFVRFLCPDFRWLNRANKAEMKQVYRDHLDWTKTEIAALYTQKIEANRRYPAYKDFSVLDLLHETINKAIAIRQKQAKKYAWILSLLRPNASKLSRRAITDADIARAKEVPIETLYEGLLRQVGSRLTGKCPFHSERTASFTIYLEQNSWWCYGCSEGGSVVDYVMAMRKCEFLEAVKFLLTI